MSLEVLPPARIDPLNAALAHADLGTELGAATRAAPLADSAEASHRTVVHRFEAVRDERNAVIDFRLDIHAAGNCEAMRRFTGLRMVEVGPSVAPGEALWMLKQVLETGEPVQNVTMHLADGVELQFHQSAVRSGDAVLTTTTISTRIIESRAA